ncbi:MAG TPA: amidohydrolase family protein [Xanthobacteraceae bacterium]|jgi:cytosine deaminase|nr:amidohydrolase family protein [Xanthobacteraceae bacterium]
MDLIIRNARLHTRPEDGPVDIGVDNGRIAAIAPKLATDGKEQDAAGGLVCAGLIETHIHLDKSRIIERCPPEETREVNPVKSVAPMKKTWTAGDVHARAARTLEECILHGATRMRTQVEVDPGIGMRGFEAVSALIGEYKWAIDIEICVFPQEGLTNYPGTDELVVEGLKRGAKVVGGAPRYDTDGPAQIERIFALGREFDVDIDIHLDVGPTADHLYVHQVCDLTEKYRRGGRVVAGHMAKLSTMPPDRLKEVARRLADVGVAVTVLPATDLYLMGRDQDHNVRRGVADANFLLAHGVNCSLSSNNVLNPATPYGDCSLIRMANMHANLLQVRHPKELRECFAMLTERSARLLNLKDYGLAVGNPADIVIFDAQTPEQAIAEVRNPLAAFKRGRQTMTRQPAQLIRPS